MKLEIPAYVTVLMQTLKDNGYECFVVGGAIRSLLLSLPVHDYDLTTNALPRQMEEVFHDFHTIETGIQHGTITVISDHHPVEITTYRKDSTYKDHRHPDHVEFTSAIREDCARRDFTINAFCYSDDTGILDFFHGREDLNARLIRCIGDPYRRFEEDALRILRAVRFAAQLNFTIEENTSRALLEKKDSLSYVSAERIREEFTGYLKASGCAPLFYPYRSVFSVFLPEIRQIPKEEMDVLVHQLHGSVNDADIRMALLLSTSAFSDPHRILNRLKYSNADSRKIQDMIHHKEAPMETRIQIRHLLHDLSCDFRDYLHYRQALDQRNYIDAWHLYQETQRDHDCYTLKSLAVSGRDMIALGKKGKAISDTLNTLLNAVMDDQVPNNKEDLIAYAQEL